MTSDTEGLDRSPPHNFDAEQALLGAILMSNRSLEKVSEFLRSDHFADPVHGRIYEACATLASRNQIATPVTLKTYLADDAGLKDLGGDRYLMDLAGAAASIINAGDYGRLIFDLALRRELIGIGEDIVNDAFDAALDRDAAAVIEQAERALSDLAGAGARDKGARSVAEVVPTMMEEARAAQQRGGVGLPTGLADLDEKLGGMAPGNLLILAGRPGMGKSAIAPCIARHVAQTAGAVAYLTLEMTAEEVCQRLTADASGVAYEVLRMGTADDEQWEKIERASRITSSLPIHIDDAGGLKIEQLRARVRRLHRRHGLKLVIIDHLGLIKMAENRLQGLTHISANLKEMAKELNIPVLALSQLNRSVEGRDDKRPQLSDLRESGSIEQDADVVMFIYREHYYLERSEPARKAFRSDSEFWGALADWREKCRSEEHRAQVILAKNRHGRSGVVSLFCDMGLSRFRSLASTSGGGRE